VSDPRLLAIGFVAGDGSGGSGGDIRFFEILMRAARDREVVLLTSPGGAAMARRFGLPADIRVIADATGHLLVAGIRSTAQGISKMPRDLRGFDGVIYTSSDHLYDCLPAAWLVRRNGARWMPVNHWVEEVPWKDDRGGTAIVPRYAYWAQRRAARWLMKRYSKTVLAVSRTTREKMIDMAGFEPGRVAEVDCGVDLHPETMSITEHYDALFMKRLSPGKGVWDLLPIWQEVTRHMPEARLAIAGDGMPDVNAELARRIAQSGIAENIDVLGGIDARAEAYGRMKAARLFILPTHEENWAIVIGEAMAVGTPVIAYDLPELTAVWGDAVRWIPRGDTLAFGKAVVELLTDDAAREQLIEAGMRRVADLAWDEVAARELAYLR